MPESDDLVWMHHALKLAEIAGSQDEVPVGAVIVRDGELLGEGSNQPVSSHDPTAHAEIIALRQAGQAAGNYRLPGAILYVTIEPCTMCVGAMIHARIEKVIFGAREPKAGALCSNLQLAEQDCFNHHLGYEEGVLADDCRALMTDFFQIRRGSF